MQSAILSETGFCDTVMAHEILKKRGDCIHGVKKRRWQISAGVLAVLLTVCITCPGALAAETNAAGGTGQPPSGTWVKVTIPNTPEKEQEQENAALPDSKPEKGSGRKAVEKSGRPAERILRHEVPAESFPDERDSGLRLGFITLKHPERLAGFLQISIPGVRGAARGGRGNTPKTGDPSGSLLWAVIHLCSVFILLRYFGRRRRS